MMVSDTFTDEQRHLLQQSHEAFLYDRKHRMPEAKHQCAAINGEIVSDSDDCEEYLMLNTLQTEKARELISKRRKTIKRRGRYLKHKLFAQRNFLARKRSKTVKGILRDCPDIGNVIEEYVKERNIGADAWRRTGVLTFDGNTKVKQKVTFKRIKEHVESVYKRKFAFSSIVQLCVARNCRRLSAKRYRGVARVTCRRARKGFQLKYNQDSHWSNALYRGLNIIQYTDGRHILNINRDDASGFRLDTMQWFKIIGH